MWPQSSNRSTPSARRFQDHDIGRSYTAAPRWASPTAPPSPRPTRDEYAAQMFGYQTLTQPSLCIGGEMIKNQRGNGSSMSSSVATLPHLVGLRREYAICCAGQAATRINTVADSCEQLDAVSSADVPPNAPSAHCGPLNSTRRSFNSIQPVSLHLLVQRGAVDIQHRGGLLAVPSVAPQRGFDHRALRRFQRLAQ